MKREQKINNGEVEATWRGNGVKRGREGGRGREREERVASGVLVCSFLPLQPLLQQPFTFLPRHSRGPPPQLLLRRRSEREQRGERRGKEGRGGEGDEKGIKGKA